MTTSWVGNTTEEVDSLDPFHARALAAALDRAALPGAGDPLPPAWEWLYFLHAPTARSTREDGHPAIEGGLLPPSLPPRRMWASSEIHHDAPLVLGAPAKKRSTIAAITTKTGRSGALVFVDVAHEITQRGQSCIREKQTLVYREAPTGSREPLPPVDPDVRRAEWSRHLRPDPVLLFRYSALTYNAHRIHYDRDYAIGVEQYPGLVVHGPLLATLLLELVATHAPGRRVKSFRFRAQRPAFAGESLQLLGAPSGDEVELWTRDARGALGVAAHATLEAKP